jgi:hypothetical protein
MRVPGREVRAHGYIRVKPEILFAEGSSVKLRATFPTVTRRCWHVRAAALFAQDGSLLYESHFNSDLWLFPGHTAQVDLNLNVNV